MGFMWFVCVLFVIFVLGVSLFGGMRSFSRVFVLVLPWILFGDGFLLLVLFWRLVAWFFFPAWLFDVVRVFLLLGFGRDIEANGIPAAET